MAGKDASYAFAMMSLKAEDAHANLAGTLGMLTRPARHGPLATARSAQASQRPSSAPAPPLGAPAWRL